MVLISNPNKVLSTLRAVNKLNAEPANSKKVQNTVVKNNSTAITQILCFAIFSILLASYRRYPITIVARITKIKSTMSLYTISVDANTIIINKADRFGLAQLHQLRGRVGRSERQSYAYLLIPPKHKLTPQGEKRLQAIEAIEDLGVGFILATHDLEIRGAGEILGDEQSGQIQKIGFTLYKDILEQTIKTMRSDDSNQVIDNFSTDINLNIPALINEEYMPDVHLRLTMYKRISSTFDNKDLNKIKSELLFIS